MTTLVNFQNFFHHPPPRPFLNTTDRYLRVSVQSFSAGTCERMRRTMDMTIVDVAKAEKGRTQLYTRPSFLFYPLSLSSSSPFSISVSALYVSPSLSVRSQSFSLVTSLLFSTALQTIVIGAVRVKLRGETRIKLYPFLFGHVCAKGGPTMTTITTTTMMMVISRSFDIVSSNL